MSKTKLRFGLDQATLMRKGIACPKSTHIVEVDPATLTQKQRDLIADRLSNGIDVVQLKWDHFSLDPVTKIQSYMGCRTKTSEKEQTGNRIIATAPTFEALMEAIEADEKRLNAEPIHESETEKNKQEKTASDLMTVAGRQLTASLKS